MHTTKIISLAGEFGLVFRGGFTATSEDQVPAQFNGGPSISLLLFGQAGKSLWPVFSQSPELSDGLPHPMNRWSERVGQTIAERLDGRLLLPFGDAPYHPFLHWAARVEAVQPSRLGMLIHPVHGLWHAYRFAIALPESVSGFTDVEKIGSICGQCQKQPCLKKCPVKAFNGEQYDVKACFEYLQKTPEALCHSKGCLAREACPEGQQSHYSVEQKRFHMKQFTLALEGRFNEEISS